MKTSIRIVVEFEDGLPIGGQRKRVQEGDKDVLVLGWKALQLVLLLLNGLAHILLGGDEGRSTRQPVLYLKAISPMMVQGKHSKSSSSHLHMFLLNILDVPPTTGCCVCGLVVLMVATAEAGAVQLHPHDTGLVVAVLQMHYLVFL
jgi:hypothetical protein